MDAETKTMSELREQLVERATVDETFRARLLADPNAAIEEETGLSIPDGFTVKVHEDVGDTSHLVLPPSSALGEADLEMMAGGGVWDDIVYSLGSGWGNRDGGGG